MKRPRSKRVEWKVHTVNLLLAQPFNIFGNLLANVAERALILNDPELNILMLRLTLYEQGDPEKFSHRQIQAAFAGQRKRMKKGSKS